MFSVRELALRVNRGLKNSNCFIESLVGSCAIGTNIFIEEYRKHFGDIDFVVAYHQYDDYYAHCWAETTDKIIDVSAIQLSISDDVYIASRHMMDAAYSIYRPVYRNKQALTAVNTTWHPNQRINSFRWRWKNDRLILARKNRG